MNRNQILELFPIGPEFPDHRLCDPVSAIAGGVGLVGNVVGGIMGKSAASKAADIQAKAAQAASDKVGVAIGDANKPISEATGAAQTGATTAAANAAAGVNTAVTGANALLDPYSQAGQAAAGTLQAGTAAGGDFNKTPTLADLQIDPGYAFRQQQGELALSRSAAAHGGALGGGAVKDALNFNSGLASQEYQNAFNRFQTSTQNRFGNLMAVSNAGQAAGTQQGNNLVGGAQYGGNITSQAAQYAGTTGLQGAEAMGQNTLGGAQAQANLLTGGANAQAAGIVGGANALAGGIAGGANAVGSAAMINMLRNPALGPVSSGSLPSGGVPASVINSVIGGRRP